MVSGRRPPGLPLAPSLHRAEDDTLQMPGGGEAHAHHQLVASNVKLSKGEASGLRAMVVFSKTRTGKYSSIRSSNAWLLLVLFSALVPGCAALEAGPVDLVLKSNGLNTIAKGLALGVDGDALTCPSSAITTPLSLRMVCYAALFYACVLTLLVIWLLWRRALWGFYVNRQIKRALLWRRYASSRSPSGSTVLSTKDSRKALKQAARGKDYVCVSPILEHGGMFLQQHGYRRSIMGCLVHALVVASIVVSVVLPFLAGFAANSLTPADKVTRFVPPVFYEDMQGVAPEGADESWKRSLEPSAITASPQCIKLRIYIFAVCFMWCLTWMAVVHCFRHKIKLLRLTPACLSNATHMLVERKLQKILLLPSKREPPAPAQQPSSPDDEVSKELEFLVGRTDLGEPPLLSTFEPITTMPHSSDRCAETSRIRLVYNNTRGYFRPVAAIYERKAREAALSLSDAVEEVKLSKSEEDSKSGFLGNLSTSMVPPKELVYRLDADAEGGVTAWSVRPIATLLVASFLQDEFYLVTLMALWYQAFSLNNLQAVILLLLPLFELAFGVYSLRKGEQQLVGIMQREAQELERKRTLCVRLKEGGAGSANTTEAGKEKSSAPVLVLQRIPGSQIVPGDIVLLQPGDEVPCDLLLVHGSVSLDESHLTGETEPVMKVPLKRKPRHESLESVVSEAEPAKVAEDEVLDPSSVSGNVVGCIYAGSKIIHTSCRSDIASVMFEDALEAPDEHPVNLERELDDPAAFLLEGECCWGIAVRTHGETMRGQLLRQLHLPMIIRFKYHDQFPYVLLIVTLFAFALVAIQTGFTRNLVDTFRFGVEKVLRMLPLYLPALWGLCASLNAKRLATGFSKSNLSHAPTYKAAAVFPGLLPLAAKIRIVCFDKTGTLTQSSLSLLGAHAVAGNDFGNLVLHNPDHEEGLIDSIQIERTENSIMPLTEATASLTDALSPPLLQCLACCNSLHLTPHGMAAWTRKQQKAFRDKYVFRADELRAISQMEPALSLADIDGVDIEKQALSCSGFKLVEIASSSLKKAERFRLTRATTAWAAEMQKQRKTRHFLVPPTMEIEDFEEQPEQPPMLEVVETYCFDQQTGLMSVIARECSDTAGCRGQRGYVFCKGRYEEVAKACYSSCVPPNYVDYAQKYAKDGIYVVGAAYRELTPEELDEMDERDSAPPRSTAESNLSCLGLVLFRNELRSDAREAVEMLTHGGIRCVMLTGDNPYTALAVARRASMIHNFSRTYEVGERDFSLPMEQEHPPVKLQATVLLGNAILKPPETPFSGASQPHGVRWTDMHTCEEVDPWKVYYTDEFKELVVTMAAAKILMKEPDTQLLPVSESEEDIEDPWRRTSRQQALREHEERRALLPQITDWQSETPSLFDRIFFRIRIFARMSPMGKKLIVLHFQRRGLTTCMVGDGGNDSLAIRQADIGVEMGQVQPAPFSAPFAILHTSEEQKTERRLIGKDGVRGIVDIVRAGRCSLSTAMAIYRLHISYGLLVATASLLLVMAQYVGFNTISMLFLDIVVLLGLSGAMLFSSPVSGSLAKKSPSSSPFGAGIVLSVLSLVAVDLGALALLLYLFYGPAGFPPPCYWIQSRLRRVLQNRADQVREILSGPILRREKVLDEKEAELKAEEQEVQLMKHALEQKAIELHQEQQNLQSKQARNQTPVGINPPKGELVSRPLAVAPHAPHEQGSPSAARIPSKNHNSLTQLYKQLREQETHEPESLLPHHPLNALHVLVDDLSIDADHAGSLRPRVPGDHQLLSVPSSSSLSPSFFQEAMRFSFMHNADSSGAVCSTDGHAESALMFVWAGICTLHAAMLFISGNVFRKPAWKNRILLPLSVLILAFFVAIVLLPPGPLPCVFNVSCTAKASDALHAHPLYNVVQLVAGDSAASTLHDAAAGPGTLEAAADKAAAELQETDVEPLQSRANSLPTAAEAADLMKQTQKSVKHLWTQEEATTFISWFSWVLLSVLVATCILNTLIQFVCLHKVALTEWWRQRQASPQQGASLPL
ncbi:hypothetical protein ACSSS7_002507 [Eimeria intestinalis]